MKKIILDFWLASKCVAIGRYDRMIYVKNQIITQYPQKFQELYNNSSKQLWLDIEQAIPSKI